jgi:cytochrome b
MTEDERVAIKVWDLPVRLFHWVMLLMLVVQFVTGKVGLEWMTVHVISGYAMLSLVIFRLMWGFAGSTHARFASFIAGPAATLRFARRLFSRQAVPQMGHNPLGGWMVMALLASLSFQVGTGLFANDGVSTAGPFAVLVSLETSTDLSQLHRLNMKVLLVLSALHVAAVVFHLLVKKDLDILSAMFDGVKRVPVSFLRERREAPRDKPPRRLASRENSLSYNASPKRAVGLLLLAIAMVCVVVVPFHL